MKKTCLFVAFALGLGLALALLWMAGAWISPTVAAARAEDVQALNAQTAAVVRPSVTELDLIGDSEDVRMGVYYGYDEAAGMYEVGHSFWITVTDSRGTVKAHATATTTLNGTEPYFAHSDGFCVEKDDWSDPLLGIQPGDWAYFRADDGFTNSVRVGTITARPNPSADTLAGTITAPWVVEPLTGFTWNPFVRVFAVNPDGSYFVDFSPDDLLPGMDINVQYEEPDKDQVGNNFRAPWQVFLPLLLRDY